MGEQLALEGRMAVRTPMQWQPGPGGGFSHADGALPAVPGRARSAPRRSTSRPSATTRGSLLLWMRERIHRYRECPELAWGEASVLEHDVAPVLALRSDWEGGTIVQAHNLADAAAEVPLALTGEPAGARLVDLFDPAGELALDADAAVTIPLEPYGTRWFRLLRDGERRLT